MKLNKKVLGFSLIELLVVLVIITILASIAAPTFQTAIRNSRIRSYANEMMESLNFARSEAIKRGRRLTLCKNSGSNTCKTSGNQWHGADGWLVMLNATVLKKVENISSDIEINAYVSGSGSAYKGNISYKRRGDVEYTGGVAGIYFLICDKQLKAKGGRKISIAASGRVKSSDPKQDGGGERQCS